MIFVALFESAEKGELILIEGGICQWHLRLDGKIVIKVIISTRPGAGTEMLNILKQVKNASSIFLKCPVHLKSNNWYKKKGFKLISTSENLNEWWLPIERKL